VSEKETGSNGPKAGADRKERLELLDAAGKAVGVIASASVAASVVYDWGFLKGLGLELGEIPTSLSDHVRSALVWIPGLLSASLFWLVMYLFTRRVEQGLTEEEIVASSKNPKAIGRFRKSSEVGVLAVMFLGAAGYVLFGFESSAAALVFAVPLLWLFFVSWVFSHPRVQARTVRWARMALLAGPALLFFVYFFGYARGIDARNAKSPEVRVIAKEAPQERRGTVVRYMERGVLFKQGAGKISFLPWDQVAEVHRVPEVGPRQGLVCRWFGVACGEKTDELDGV